MLSRVAENLYWISRYVERAEGLARLLEDAFSMELETGSSSLGSGPLDKVLHMLNAHAAFDRFWDASDSIPEGGPTRSSSERRDAIVQFLTLDRGSDVSIRETVARARENARGTQEAISGEAWSQLNKLHLFLNSPRAEARFAASPARFLDRIRRECVFFEALVDGTLPRTEAYHFLQVGRYLERVDVLSRVINVHCHTASASGLEMSLEQSETSVSAGHWASLLRSASAYEAYLKQARERVDPVGVVRYLLLETTFPRSMGFGIARCLDSLRAIAGGSGYGSAAERHLGQLDSELRYLEVDDLFHEGLDAFLSGVQATCAAAARDVHQAYFRT